MAPLSIGVYSFWHIYLSAFGVTLQSNGAAGISTRFLYALIAAIIPSRFRIYKLIPSYEANACHGRFDESREYISKPIADG
ncbi:MAG TPA: hypothetical protein VIP70_10815 [Nitrososphaeraceae archaeon]